MYMIAHQAIVDPKLVTLNQLYRDTKKHLSGSHEHLKNQISGRREKKFGEWKEERGKRHLK